MSVVINPAHRAVASLKLPLKVPALIVYAQALRLSLIHILTGLCFIPQAVGAFSLAGPASKLVPALGPRRALAAGMSLGLLALVGSALSIARGPLFGLLASLFIICLLYTSRCV